jgi:hypothetical protein
MTIPKNLTHAEVGAFLIAVGRHMVDHDLAAETVLCWDSYSEPEEARLEFIKRMNEAHWGEEITEYRGLELLALTLEEAITYNEMEKRHE